MNEKYRALIESLHQMAGTLNPFAIAETLGIEVRYVPFLSNPEGQYMKILGEQVILLNERVRELNRRYFLLAHELHHAIEHEELSGYYVQSNVTRGKLENEANSFAADLLFNYYIEENESRPKFIKELEVNYGIPEEISEEYY